MSASRPAFYGNLTVSGGPAPVRAYIEELLPDVLEGRIAEMELWDAEFIELLGPGYIQFNPDGGGHFVSATLRPIVTIAGGDAELAQHLHEEASAKCFIAASVNFPVLHEPIIVTI